MHHTVLQWTDLAVCEFSKIYNYFLLLFFKNNWIWESFSPLSPLMSLQPCYQPIKDDKQLCMQFFSPYIISLRQQAEV